MRLRRFFGLVVLSLIQAGFSGDAEGGLIATNLGPDQSFNQLGGYNLVGMGGDSSTGDSLAVQFQVTGSSSVLFGSAELALQYRSGINSIQVSLMSDSGGIPGVALDTMDISNLSSNPSLVTVTATDTILLNPGTNYWLTAVAAPSSSFSWMMNNQGVSGHLAYDTTLGNIVEGWQAMPNAPDLAFQVDSVGSPGSFVTLSSGLFLVGLLGLGTRRGRRWVRAVNRGRGRRTVYRYFY